MARTSKNNRKSRSGRRKRSVRNAANSSGAGRNYSFHNRFYVEPQKHSEKGKIALGIGLGMILIYIVLVVVSALTGANLSAYYGSLGLLGLIGSIAALIMALQSRGERQSFKLFPNLALAASIAASLIWIVTYGIGMAIS